MSRDYKLYLKDMLTAGEHIRDYLGAMTLEDLKADTLRLDAILHNFMVLGEAAKGVPDIIRQKYPNIDWEGAAGLRDVIAHQYFRVNIERIWWITQQVLPDLTAQVQIALIQETTLTE